MLKLNSAAELKWATILVGEDQKRFVVHEHLLTHHSEFFRAALIGNFKEAKDKVVRLEDIDPFIFECFVHWLYYQRFPDASKNDDEELVKAWGTEEASTTLATSLIKLYILADQCMVPRLKRAALDLAYHLFHMSASGGLPDDEHAKCAFNHLQSEDPLCQLLVDVNFHHDRETDDWPKIYEAEVGYNWPFEYLLAFARRTTKVVGDVRWNGKDWSDFELDLCDYHNHKTNEERKVCRKERKQSKKCKCNKESTSDSDSD
jgi:hypothetical protein